jgi:mono/diheme cytochrome c family protein
MVSACATNAPVPTQPTLAPFDESIESEGTPSAESPAVDQTETYLPTEIQPQASPTLKISFANDVLPILHSRCIVCHGGERREQGLNLTSYSTLIAGSENGPIIVAGDADSSLIIELVLAGRMPKRAPKLIPAQAQTLIEWINQGALDN